MSRTRRQSATTARGQALVEFALIVPLFVLIVIGIFEGARAIYTYNALSNAVDEGLREAIVHQDDAAITAETDRVLGGLASQSTLTIDGSDCGTPVETPCMYRIEIRHVFSPVLLGAIFSPVIAAEGEMAVEAINP
jgi:Flp pilus assembly protein TadG